MKNYLHICITNNDFYFGTVKTIEGLFVFLFHYIDMEVLFTFSKFRDASYKRSIYLHEKIDWISVIEDIQSIIDSVIKGVTEKAIELLCILKKNAPYYCERIDKAFIKISVSGVSYESIKFDYNENKIVINETSIEMNNFRKIMYEIITMKKE